MLETLLAPISRQPPTNSSSLHWRSTHGVFAFRIFVCGTQINIHHRSVAGFPQLWTFFSPVWFLYLGPGPPWNGIMECYYALLGPGRPRSVGRSWSPVSSHKNKPAPGLPPVRGWGVGLLPGCQQSGLRPALCFGICTHTIPILPNMIRPTIFLFPFIWDHTA